MTRVIDLECYAPALPLILEELQKNDGHWFWALKAISGNTVLCSAR